MTWAMTWAARLASTSAFAAGRRGLRRCCESLGPAKPARMAPNGETDSRRHLLGRDAPESSGAGVRGKHRLQSMSTFAEAGAIVVGVLRLFW